MAEHTPGPWEYIASTKDHGAYVIGPYGGDVCDCYTMSNPNALSARNGGNSVPLPFQNDSMDANARLIAAAPDLLAALEEVIKFQIPEVLARHDSRGADVCKEWLELKKLACSALAKARPIPNKNGEGE